MTSKFTILDGGRPVRTIATVDGESVRIAPNALREALGWELKPEGLCQGPICVRVGDRAALVDPSGVDLARLAELLDRPFAVDQEARCAALGSSVRTRARELATLEAPEFSLPDLSGELHSLANYRGKKVLLIAHASW